jgi:thioredoxin-like negative regulator of GroEL
MRGLFLALALLAAPVHGAPGVQWLTDLDSAVAQAKAGQKDILVDLYAEWCGWCKVLEREVFSTPAFAAFARDYVLLRVDTEDGAAGTALYQRFGAVSLPTTLIIDARLALIGGIAGYHPTDEFLAQARLQLDRHREYVARLEQALATGDTVTRRAAAAEARRRSDTARALPLLEKLATADKGGELEVDLPRDLLDLADAYRVEKRWDDAARVAQTAREQAGPHAGLRERADILLAAIAQERGDCTSAKVALESFLRDHPRSAFAGQAARQLSTIQQDRSGRCA